MSKAGGRPDYGHGTYSRILRIGVTDENGGRRAAAGAGSLLFQETRHQPRRLLEDTSKTALLLQELVALQKDSIFTGSPPVYEDILSSWELVCDFCGLFKDSGGAITWWLVIKVWAEDTPP